MLGAIRTQADISSRGVGVAPGETDAKRLGRHLERLETDGPIEKEGRGLRRGCRHNGLYAGGRGPSH